MRVVDTSYLMRGWDRLGDGILIAGAEDAPFPAIADGDDTALVDAHCSTVNALMLVGAQRAVTNVAAAC